MADIADIYELSPMQRGMLFQSVYAPESTAYFNQFSCVLEGALDAACLRSAWQRLVDRHAVLRTSFHWEDMERPVQVVRRRAELPWRSQDWSGAPEGEVAGRWRAHLERDRGDGFDLERAPLMRCGLVRLAEERHLFHWSHHHLLFDGWCLSLVLGELFAVYEALTAGETPVLAPVRPYGDYILWLQKQDPARARDYWRRQLGDFHEPTPLVVAAPPERGRPVVSEARQGSELSAALTERLLALAAAARVTPNTLAQAAWGLLLARYSGRDEVVFGATVAGRPAALEGVAQMVGPFINTLPVRLRVDARAALTPWLQQVQREQAGRDEYAYSALGDIQEWSSVPRGEPLFESLLIFQNYPVDEAALGGPRGLAIRQVEIYDSTDLPLTLQVTPGERWQVELLYDASRFAPEAVERMWLHLVRLLEGFAARPAAALEDFSLLTAAERRQLLVDFNGAAAAESGKTVVDLFEEQVDCTPEGIALVGGERELSYAELEAAANSLAHRLMGEFGVEPETRVGICLERGVEMFVAVLGVLKAGAAYVPLDPDYPPERLRYMLRDSGCRAVVGAAAGRAVLEEMGAAVVELDGGGSSRRPRAPLSPRNAAYAMYTSGSTGHPKGVVVEHRNLAAAAAAWRRAYGLEQMEVRLLQLASLSFDVSAGDWVRSLTNGGRLIVCPADTRLDPVALYELLARHRINIFESTPGLIAALMDHVWERGLDFSFLKLLILGSDSVSVAAFEELRRRFGGSMRVLNSYGVTEATIDTSFFESDGTPVPGAGTTPIGRPLAGTEFYVLDRQGEPAPVGVAGEIYIGGLGVSRGYLGQPALTAERFVPHPFRPGQRLYRSGDMGRWLPGGQMEFLGRGDDQVKVRGYRIELGEIESCMLAHPGVARAVVAARQTAGGGELVAYLVPEGRLEVEEVRRHLRAELPEYMVPATYVTLDELPLTPNQKVDRRALPAPAAPQRRAYAVPRTAAERTLAEIWETVLGVDKAGLHDDYFELGGDSILSMQIVSRAARAGLHLTPRDLFAHSTIAALAPLARAAPQRRVDQGPVRGPLPPTPIQARFLALDQPRPQHYNQSLLLEAPGLDRAALAGALQRLWEHHDALRLRFFREADGWRAEHLSPDAVPLLAVEDLSPLAGPAQAAALQTAMAALQRSFDLGTGPLFKAGLFTGLEDRTDRLLLVAHHLVVDGVSWRILVEDLQALYVALAEGAAPQLPPKTASYKEWAAALVARGAALVAPERAYWEEEASAAVGTMPFDAIAESNEVAAAAGVEMALDEATTGALLQEIPAAYGARPDEALLAALARAWGAWTGSARLRVDVERHGRDGLDVGLEVERTVGWFTALFPLVLDGEGTPQAALKRAVDKMRRVPSGGAGYGLLRYGHNADGRLPAADAPVQFNYLGRVDGAEAAGDWRLALGESGPEQAGANQREHMLEVDALIQGEQLQVVWTYSRKAHREETIRALAAGFEAELRALVGHCRQLGTGGFMAVEFPAARLSQEALDGLVRRVCADPEVAVRRQLRDLYPLSPMQQGMLFHSLYAPASDIYFNQFHCRIEGDLDAMLFAAAWEQAVARHAALRTVFIWEEGSEPLQAVLGGAPLAWHQEDWMGAPEAEQEARWKELLAEDRRTGLALDKAPLMRLHLARLGAGQWRFNWSQHHLLLDGWSAAIVLDEVCRCYAALHRGADWTPPPPPPFRRYIEWLGRIDGEAARAHWSQYLEGFEEPTPLLLGKPELEGRPGPAGRAEEEIEVPGDLVERLRQTARRHQLTLNTLVQGAWALQLSGYSGARDVLYGTVFSGRPPELEGAEEMVGLFINTLPVRARLEGDMEVVPWLRSLQGELALAERFAHCPLVDIQSWSQVPAGRPLFESIAIFENYPVDASLEEGVAGMSFSQVEAFEPNNFPLTLVVTPAARTTVKVAYDTERFDAATARHLLAHYLHLLEQLAVGERRTVAELELITPDERRQIVEEWNATTSPRPSKPVVELIAERAARYPDRAALQCGAERLTYGQLEVRSNQLARLLQKRAELGPEARVGVLLRRSLAMAETLLAIWKCGAAYVPVDADYPAARVRAILRDSGVRLIVTDGELPPQGLEEVAPLVLLERSAGERAALGTAPLNSTGSLESLAYVIYTSGSTGRPKGAMVEQRGMLNHILAMVESLELDESCAVAQTASHCFDISVWQFFAALVAGGRTVIYSDDAVLDAAGLPQRLAADGVTAAQFVPSYLAVLLDHLEEQRERAPLAGLRHLATIGEVLKPELVRRCFALYPGLSLVNTYGPTEASDSIAHFPMRAPPPYASVPVGRPVANMRLYVLGAEDRLCPVGVKGEICVGGTGVGRGYLGDAERTRAAFGEDPFCPGARLYRTGDIGCYGEDGTLFFFGRRDFQVKVRGHRIELGEIESRLAQLEGVGDAVVVAPTGAGGEPVLCAYATLRPGSAHTAATLREHLAEVLPHYMVPARLAVLAALPTLPNGKVDRQALPQLEGEERVAGGRPPGTEVERRLAAIWEEVLEVEGVGAEDSFFALGGHSLKAVQVVGRVRREWGAEVPLEEFLARDNVAALAALLAESGAAEALPPTPIAALPARSHYPASHAQKRFWLASRAPHTAAAYHMSGAFEVEGELNAAVLRRACAAMAQRHESLRSSLEMAEGQLVQRVAPEPLLDWEEGEAESAAARAAAAAASAQPFDLARPPLWRVRLWRLGERHHLLALTMHHAIGDAWSLRLLAEETFELYEAELRGAAAPLPPLRLQYRDCAAWHQQLLSSAAGRRQRRYWLEQLNQRPPRLELPLDRPRPTPPAHRGQRAVLELDAGTTAALRQWARRQRTSLYGVCIGAVAALLYRYSGQEDFLVGAQAAGRMHPELEGQIGCFVNTLPLRLRVRGGDTLAQTVEACGRVLAGALDHQAYPFDLLLEELEVRTPVGHMPLFDVQLDHAIDWEARLPEGLAVRPLAAAEPGAHYDLSFLVEEGDTAAVAIEYNAALFAELTVEQMRDRLERILRAGVADAQLHIDQIALSESAERAPRQVKIELNF